MKLKLSVKFSTPQILLLAAMLALVWWFVAMSQPRVLAVQIVNPGHQSTQIDHRELHVAVWNLGYGGLGADSDYFMDGGEGMRAPSVLSVERNIAGIVNTLQALDVNVTLIQEYSGAGFLNRGVDLGAAIAESFAPSWLGVVAEIEPRWLPQPIRPRLAKAVLTRSIPVASEVVELPGQGDKILGVIERTYSAQIITLANSEGPDWALINIHLSAFDEGGVSRNAQLDAALELAQSWEARGFNVVMGGDWNLRLADVDFAHTTEEEYLFWLFDFPAAALPPGWRIVADLDVPSVRTNERRYQRGENYTTVIDGFIVSSGVETVSVETLDLDFAHSDHQPVVARFVARAAD